MPQSNERHYTLANGSRRKRHAGLPLTHLPVDVTPVALAATAVIVVVAVGIRRTNNRSSTSCPGCHSSTAQSRELACKQKHDNKGS